MYNLICEHCGKPFQSKKNTRRFCCKECYNKYIENCKRTGNILISALHTDKITREQFFGLCSDEQREFYEQIIDLDITKQVVIKQGELLENLDEDNQQPNIYRNIYVGSETNGRVLTDNAEDSNVNTSALPLEKGEDIVQTACITDKDEDAEV